MSISGQPSRFRLLVSKQMQRISLSGDNSALTWVGNPSDQSHCLQLNRGCTLRTTGGLLMSNKTYRLLVVGTSIFVAVGLGLFLGKTSSGQKNERKGKSEVQLLLVPKAHLPIEEARW